MWVGGSKGGRQRKDRVNVPLEKEKQMGEDRGAEIVQWQRTRRRGGEDGGRRWGREGSMSVRTTRTHTFEDYRGKMVQRETQTVENGPRRSNGETDSKLARRRHLAKMTVVARIPGGVGDSGGYASSKCEGCGPMDAEPRTSCSLLGLPNCTPNAWWGGGQLVIYRVYFLFLYIFYIIFLFCWLGQ
jgi:hypothetical protein